MSDLKPCAHCGGAAKKIVAPFGFAIECEECGAQSNYRDSVTAAIEAWNRRTQPEATAPAQDLSAAILAITANKRAADHLKMREFNGYLEGFAEARNKAAALASSANALSVGDRVDALAVLKSIIEDGYLSDTNTARGHAILQSQKAK